MVATALIMRVIDYLTDWASRILAAVYLCRQLLCSCTVVCNISVNNANLPVVDSACDLGVSVTCDLFTEARNSECHATLINLFVLI